MRDQTQSNIRHQLLMAGPRRYCKRMRTKPRQERTNILWVIYSRDSTHSRTGKPINSNKAPEGSLPQFIIRSEGITVDFLSMCTNVLSEANANTSQMPSSIIRGAFQKVPRCKLEQRQYWTWRNKFDTYHTALEIHQSRWHHQASICHIHLLVILPTC